jgi:hypothetical protein
MASSPESSARPEWHDLDWWRDQLSCVAIADPVLCNHRITLAHYDLSMALSATIGPGSGANFHTWAVWGSWKAGTTIRQQDIPGLRLGTMSLGSLLGAALAGVWRPARGYPRPVGVAAALGGMLAASLVTNRLLNRASRQVLEGNRLVLEDIGDVTARYLSTMGPLHTPNAEALAAFLATLRPGSTDQGGQDLLRKAFANYDTARWETHPDRRQESMLLANMQAILHEHMRLEPYIDAAVPRPLRRAVTARLLTFQIGRSQLNVASDVPSLNAEPYSAALQRLENKNLLDLLHGETGWDRTPNQLAGSRALDWSKLAQRMNYISDLFRSRHLDPTVFQCPYVPSDVDRLRRGLLPLAL